MKTIHFFAVIFLTFFLTSCWLGMGTKNLIDDYEVSWGDPYTQLEEGYCVGCRSGCGNDRGIQDIKRLKWNKGIIITEKNRTEEGRWFIFKAKGEQLECCNGDTIIGPITKLEVDSIIKRYKYTNLEEMIFIE